MRFILVDRVDELSAGKYVRGIKNIAFSEDVFTDHFPGYSLFPGTLIIEALAQLAGFLIECSVNEGVGDRTELRRAMLVQIDRAKFHLPIIPGDRLVLTAEVLSIIDGAAQVRCLATRDDARAAEATLTFVARQTDIPQIHDQRKEIYEQWTRHLKEKPAILSL